MPPVTVPSDRRAFEVMAPFEPAGDQPKAIESLATGVAAGHGFETLLGITGSDKSATIASTIERAQRPTLVLAPTSRWPRSSPTSCGSCSRTTGWSRVC